jgi:hypothetical protein
MNEITLKHRLRLMVELVDLEHLGELQALLGADVHALTAADA